METTRHQRLKRLAVQWLLQIGCRAVAVEVTCPIGRFRVDAAGWLDHVEGDPLPPPRPLAAPDERGPSLFSGVRPPRRSGPARPRTIVVECKQSRADFFRNAGGRESLAEELALLRRRARRLEETRIKRFEPELRRVEPGLFESVEQWAFSATRIGAYHRLLARIEALERDLYARSKFERLRTYRLADHVFVLCPRGLLHPRELPTGLGLLECPTALLRRARVGDAAAPAPSPAPLDATALRRRVDATRLDCLDARRVRLLRNIAVAATRDAAWRSR
jgi:hypothetical protein